MVRSVESYGEDRANATINLYMSAVGKDIVEVNTLDINSKDEINELANVFAIHGMYSGVVEAPSHTHALTEVPAVPATCTEDGNKAYYECTAGCGKLFADKDGKTATTLADVTVTKLGHDMSKATCTEVSTCQREGCVYTEGSALGHDWSGSWTIIKQASASEEGKQETLCTRNCGYKKVVTVPTDEVRPFGRIGFSVPSKSKPKAGLDYRYMMIIEDRKYIRFDAPRISNKQITTIDTNYSIIEAQALEYLNSYIRVAKKKGEM